MDFDFVYFGQTCLKYKTPVEVFAGLTDIYEKILREKLSVRQTEELVKSLKPGHSLTAKSKGKTLPNYIKKSLSDMSAYLGHKVDVTVNARGKGKISIPFHSQEDFERIKGCAPSFLRSFIREFKNWEFNRDIFDLDKDGYGVVVYSVRKNKMIYDLPIIVRFFHTEPRDH